MQMVTVERRGGAGIITFSNPPVGVINRAGSEEMRAALRELVADEDIRSIIITGGQPGIFIRHYDVTEFVDLLAALDAGHPLPPKSEGPPTSGIGALFHEIAAAPKPVIAAINGICMGGGLEVALACDIRIADPKAESIGLPETRVGTFPAGGGPSRLARMIGEAEALNMILRGLIFTGEEAYERGLVTELAADPLARALEISNVWEGRVCDGLAHAKRIIRSALDRPLAESMADESRGHTEVIQSPAVRKNIRRVLPPGDIRDL